jgi:uncharacterized protein (TIGR02147 family)
MTIFKYLNYRLWIRDWKKSMPHRGRGQLAKIAAAVGSNSTLISQILQGSRDFSMEQAYLLINFFNFNPLESKYWLLLVQIERAGNASLKAYLLSELENLRKQSQQISNRLQERREMTDSEKALLVSSWKPSAILMQCGCGKGFSIEELSEELGIHLQKVKETVIQLCEIGLLRREANKYLTGTTRLHIPKGSPYISRHYTNWRMKAIDKAEDILDDELMFTSVAAISENDVSKLKEKILSLISDYSKQVAESGAEKVVCLNIDYFKVSKGSQ